METTNTFRPMRRFMQALEAEECQALLAGGYRGFLSLVGDGGYPYTVPLNYVYEAGKLYFHCAKEGHKTDAIRACDKACFTVLGEPVKETDDWWYHVCSVICFGRIRIIDSPEETDFRLRQIGRKYFPENYDMEGDMQRNGPRALVLEFTVEHCSGKRVKEK